MEGIDGIGEEKLVNFIKFLFSFAVRIEVLGNFEIVDQLKLLSNIYANTIVFESTCIKLSKHVRLAHKTTDF